MLGFSVFVVDAADVVVSVLVAVVVDAEEVSWGGVTVVLGGAVGECVVLAAVVGECVVLGIVVGECVVLGIVVRECVVLGIVVGECVVRAIVLVDGKYGVVVVVVILTGRAHVTLNVSVGGSKALNLSLSVRNKGGWEGGANALFLHSTVILSSSRFV